MQEIGDEMYDEHGLPRRSSSTRHTTMASASLAPLLSKGNDYALTDIEAVP